ncbi:hypothetical protein D3C80_1584740 [compost metagenome]
MQYVVHLLADAHQLRFAQRYQSQVGADAPNASIVQGQHGIPGDAGITHMLTHRLVFTEGLPHQFQVFIQRTVDADFLPVLQVKKGHFHPRLAHQKGIVERIPGRPLLKPGVLAKALQHGHFHHAATAPANAQQILACVQVIGDAYIKHGDGPEQTVLAPGTLLRCCTLGLVDPSAEHRTDAGDIRLFV